MYLLLIIPWTIHSLFKDTEACTPFESRGMSGMSMGVPSEPVGRPPSGVDTISDQMNKALGKQTHLGGNMPITIGDVSNQIVHSSQLKCFNFDEKCRWKNIDGVLLDELDWFQGIGYLDEKRLQVATGTSVTPEGYYAIVATEKIHGPTGKAILASDIIKCQLGPAELKFMYWTSPKVQIKVCTKKVGHIFPEYDFCSRPIEVDDPGPASIMIADQGEDSFQIYIIAENFIWQAIGLQGGFAVIDNIDYRGEMCGANRGNQWNSNENTGQNNNAQFAQQQIIGQYSDDEQAPPLPPVPSFSESKDTSYPQLVNQKRLEEIKQQLGRHEHDSTQMHEVKIPIQTKREPFSGKKMTAVEQNELGTEEEIFAGKPEFDTIPVENEDQTQEEQEAEDGISMEKIAEMTMPKKGDKMTKANGVASLDSRKTPRVEIRSACEVLSCTFDSGRCLDYATKSNWKVVNHPVGNPLTGVRDGSFAYITGPKIFSRLVTPPFDLTEEVYFVFAYHKVDRNARFRVYAKRIDSHSEHLIYEAPQVTKDSRRWFREGKILERSLYQYLAFEVRNLTSNNYIGLDEFMILNGRRQPFCEPQRS